MRYRSDIDGLRAIAVLSVIFFHSGIDLIGAGYAGVDIFFVISGYLIGGRILNDLSKGTFAFRDFYARRFLRILPALYFVIIVSIIVGAFTMVPHDYQYFFGASFSAVLWLSNVWFMTQIDYFNPQAALDPMLHTWSLGVEEQFYLFAPFLLFLLWKFLRKRIAFILALLMLVSFGLAIAFVQDSPSSTFYLIHTRAWELLAGVLSAMVPAHKIQSNIRRSAVYIGLGLLVFSVLEIPPSAGWPGAWTALPVLGTAFLLVFGNEDTLVRRLLELKPVTFLGLISYSAYLWHQPVFSFLELTGNRPTTKAFIAATIVVVLVLAALSWRYIEQPFRRNGALPAKTKRALLWAASVTIIIGAFGAHFSKGYPARVPAEVETILAQQFSYGPNHKPCLRSRADVEGVNLAESCILGADVPPSVALIGDSHANRLGDKLGNELAKRGKSLQVLTLSSCQPVPGLINYTQTRAPRCPEFNAKVADYVSGSSNFDTVVMFATWDNFINRNAQRDMFGGKQLEKLFSYPLGQNPFMDDDARIEAFTKEMAASLKRMEASGKEVIIVLSLPRPDVNIPRLYARQVWSGNALPQDDGYDIALFHEQAELGRRVIFEAIRRGEIHPGTIRVVDPEEAFCDTAQCYLVKDGAILYSDANHPSLSGVDLLLPLIIDQMESSKLQIN